ncbi:MAG: sigma 54-interacting transcriptional regulator, partial [Thermodesulfobacteriota bacterium]
MTNKIYLERLQKSSRLMKAAIPDVLLDTKPSNMFCLRGGGRLGAYAKIPQEGKVALGDPQTDVKDVKSLTHFDAENIYFRQEIKLKHQLDHILGQSDGLKYVLYRAEQVAPTNTTVLILGETGTGKELIAAAIHNMSPRKDRPLITVNCAALPGNLIESELFGREKGAFTGADTRQVGRFEVAHGSRPGLPEGIRPDRQSLEGNSASLYRGLW